MGVLGTVFAALGQSRRYYARSETEQRKRLDRQTRHSGVSDPWKMILIFCPPPMIGP
jgi:hypothetical protein